MRRMIAEGLLVLALLGALAATVDGLVAVLLR